MDILKEALAECERQLGKEKAARASGEMRRDVGALEEMLRTDPVARNFDTHAMALRLWVRGVGVMVRK